MPENASLDTLKRQRCATASCSATPPYSPSGCPTQLTNKSKLQMSVRHVRVRGRETCTCFCVCVCALHISLRRRLCLILHFTCAIFCFEKPLLPAGSSTCQTSHQPHSAPLVLLLQIGNNLLQLQLCLPNCQWKCSTTGAICFMHEQSCTYIWTPVSVSASLCVGVCVPIIMCGHEGVRVCVRVCVPACVCLQSQQLPIGSKISQLQSYAPKMMINESVLVLRLFRLPLSLSFSFYSPFNFFTSSSVHLHLLLSIYFACILRVSESSIVCRKVRYVCVKKKQTKSKSREGKI